MLTAKKKRAVVNKVFKTQWSETHRARLKFKLTVIFKMKRKTFVLAKKASTLNYEKDIFPLRTKCSGTI